MTEAVYLDHNATTPLCAAAQEAMQAAMSAVGNPSSIHSFGRRARQMREDARRQLAEALGVKPAQIIFTSGATEANNSLLAGLGRQNLVLSAIEHESLRVLALGKADSRIIPTTPDGLITPEALAACLNGADHSTSLVSVMRVNNEIGTIQDSPALAAIAHQQGALFHVDAAQALGKIPLDFTATGCDVMTLSAHKCGGPAGIGAIILREGLGFQPFLRGGGQEGNRRAGTEALILIAGFAAAAAWSVAHLEDFARLSALRDKTEAACLHVRPDAVIYGRASSRVANTSMIGLPDKSAQTQLITLDLAGYAVSSGSACSSGKVTPSHVLTALGVSAEQADHAIRISLGHGTTEAEIDGFIQAWRHMATRKD